MDVVLSSHNAGKLAELAALLAPLGWRLRPVSEFSDEIPEEPACSFVENALIKARFAAQVSGLPAIADDSGLEVAALRGAPGVRSARYAGENAGDADNNRKLLAALEGVADDQRDACFVCVMVFMRHARDPVPVIAQGRWRGRILRQPRGRGGFGYDPLFEAVGQGCSAAELDAALKNRLSHRGLAARQLSALLQDVHD